MVPKAEPQGGSCIYSLEMTKLYHSYFDQTLVHISVCVTLLQSVSC